VALRTSVAEKEVQRAIALNPNNAWAHQAYGYQLSSVARSTMPPNARWNSTTRSEQAPIFGGHVYRAGRYYEALQRFREYLSDATLSSHRFIAAIYEREGLQKEAVAEC